MHNLNLWEEKFRTHCKSLCEGADSAHDVSHYYRVVKTAKQLAEVEKARLEVVVPAVWLHDYVYIAKNDPRRSQASRISAEAAIKWLDSIGYEKSLFADIAHAIEAHSFSAGITARTIEAKVVQDADRLDGVGAIGIARCFMVGGMFNRRIYDPEDAFAEKRKLDDMVNTIDHFYTKLFCTIEMMQTEAGRTEGVRRAEVMRMYLENLKTEIV